MKKIFNLNSLFKLCVVVLAMGAACQDVFAAWTGSGSGTKKNGTWYVLYETTESNILTGTKTYNLSGPGASLTFQAKRAVGGLGNLNVKDNNDNSIFSGSLSTSYAGKSGSVKTTAQSITFSNGGTLRKYFQNVYVTMAQYVNAPSTTSLDCGTADINSGTTNNTFTVAWCNVPAMTYNVTGTDKDLFTVSVANNAEAGKYNTATYTVTYDHNKRAGSHSATLTITDTYGNYSKTVSLSGVTNKLTPTVTWSPNDDIFNVDDVLTATNANDLTVTLSSAGNESYISCSGNTATMLAKTSGTITVTAHVTGSEIYADKDITKDITITNLEKQHITWTQDFSRLRTTDATKSVTLNATASSGLPVTYELAGDKTGLSLTHSGNTWTLTYSATECKNTTIIAHQSGNSVYAPASSVSMPVKVIDPTKICDMTETLVNSRISIKGSSVTYNIDIPASMTVSFSRMKTGLLDVYLFGVDVEFYSGRNATGTKLYTKSYSASDINNSLSNSTISLSSFINAKSVKITTDATNGYYIDAVTYTHQKYCDVSKNALSFETYPNTTTSAQTFNVNYANYPVYIECSNPRFTITPTEFGDCSEYGTQPVSVQYTATAGGTDNGTIYVKDNTGTTLKTVNLSVTINKLAQNITSTTVASAYNTTDIITLSAEANSGETYYEYSATPEGIAVFNGSEMTFTQSGTIAVTVTQPGTEVYAPASTTVENVKVNKVSPTIATKPTVATIHYLDNFSNNQLSEGLATVTLRGVENTPIAGTFTWTTINNTLVTDQPGTHNYSVTFTPDDLGMYNPVTFSMPVVISRALVPELDMNNASVDVSRIVPEQEIDHKKTVDLTSLVAALPAADRHPMDKADFTYVVKSVSVEGLQFSGSQATAATAHIDNAAKTFYATEVGVYTLTVTSPATDWYEARSMDFDITVNKLQPEVVFSAEDTVYNVRVVKNAAVCVCENETIAVPTIRYASSDESIIREQSNEEGTAYNLLGVVHEADVATVTASFAGNAYFLSAGNSKEYLARAKYTPVFMVDGTQTRERVLKVGETATASFHYCLPYDDSATPMTYSVTPASIVEYDPATCTVTAVGAGTAVLTFYQPTDAYRYAGSREFEFTVSRNATALVLAEQVQNAGTMYVGDVLSGTLCTPNTDEVPVTVTSSNSAVLDIVNGEIRALSEGDATLTFAMTPEGMAINKWIATSESKTVHVSRRSNALAANYMATTKSYGGSETIVITSSNTDYENCPVNLVATGNGDLVAISRISGNSFLVTAKHTEGTVTLQATQEMSTAYVAASLSGITFTVGKSNYHVPIDLNATMYNDSYCCIQKEGTTSVSGSEITLGNTFWGGGDWEDKYVVFRFEGIPDKLTFSYKAYSSVLGGLGEITASDWYIQESADGNFNGKVWTSTNDNQTDYQNVTVQLHPSTRYVKLCYSGNYSGLFKDIHISERMELAAAAPATTVSAPFAFETKALGADDSEQQFIMDWYNIAPVTVTSSDSHFSVAPAAFAEYEDYGQQAVTVVYHRSVDIGVHTATVTVTNGIQTQYIYVKGETTKKTATIAWHPDIEACGFLMNPDEVCPNASVSYVATVSNSGDCTISSDNAGVISVSGSTLVANSIGTAIITVNYAGSDEFYPASASQLFTVTNDTKQTITWNQSLMGLKLGDAALALTAAASSGGAVTYSIAVGGESIAAVAGSTLTVAGTSGDTYITATQAGGVINGITYAPVSMTKRIHVGDPTKQCEDYALLNQSCTFASVQQSAGIIYTFDGPAAGTLTFSAYHDKASGTFWDNFEGVGAKTYNPLMVEEYRNYNNTWEWHTIFNQVVNKETAANYTATVDPTATRLRFSSNEEVTHHVSNITVRRGKKLSASETAVNANADCNVLFTKTIRIDYSGLDVLTASINGGFSLDKATIGNGCGTYGTEEITVSLTPTELKTYSGNIIITDGKTTETRLTIPVKVEAQPVSQTIIGFTPAAACLTTDEVVFTASVLSSNPVYYTSSDESIAVVEADGRMTILAAGEVTVTAHCDAVGFYAAAPEVSRTIRIEKVTPVVATAPVASSVFVPAVLEESVIDASEAIMRDNRGNAVSGTYAWQTAGTETTLGTHTYTAVFTPDNTAWYNSAEVTVMVEVLPRVKNIVWPLADNSAFYCYETVTLDAYTADALNGDTVNTLLVYTTDNPSVAEVNAMGTILVHGEGTVVITASSAAAGYYTAAEDMQRTVTFRKADPVIEQMPLAVPISVNQPLLRSYFYNYSVVVENYGNVAGEFRWDDETHVETTPDTYTYPVHFIPANSSYFNSLEINVPVRIVSEFWTFVDTVSHTWTTPSNWSNAGIPTDVTPDVTVLGKLHIENNKTLSSLLIDSVGEVTVTNNAAVTVKFATYLSESGRYGDLIVENGGKLTLETPLNVHDFVVRSMPSDQTGSNSGVVGNSGQIVNIENLTTVDGDIYFEFDIPAQEDGRIDEDQTYAFAVPFPVSFAEGDISRWQEIDGRMQWNSDLKHKSDYAIGAYDSQRRAHMGNGWQFVNGTVLYPGRFYMLGIDTQAARYRFRKVAGTPFHANQTMDVRLYVDNRNLPEEKRTTDITDYNWNGLANPNLLYSQSSSSPVLFASIFKNGTNTYEVVNLNSTTLAVGTPFFVQTPEVGSVTVLPVNDMQPLAARRNAPSAIRPCAVTFASAAALQYRDRMFVSASVDAEDAYELGYDLVKLEGSAKLPQCWIKAYGKHLSVNNARLYGSETEFPVTFSAPEEGSYVITMEDGPDDAEIYLMYRGTPVWNIAISPCTVQLPKGCTEDYSLLLHGRAPRKPTDLEENEGEGVDGRVEKFVRNGVLYILHDGVLYDATGRKVE